VLLLASEGSIGGVVDMGTPVESPVKDDIGEVIEEAVDVVERVRDLAEDVGRGLDADDSIVYPPSE